MSFACNNTTNKVANTLYCMFRILVMYCFTSKHFVVYTYTYMYVLLSNRISTDLSNIFSVKKKLFIHNRLLLT